MKRNTTKTEAIKLMLTGSIEEYIMYLQSLTMSKS